MSWWIFTRRQGCCLPSSSIYKARKSVTGSETARHTPGNSICYCQWDRYQEKYWHEMCLRYTIYHEDHRHFQWLLSRFISDSACPGWRFLIRRIILPCRENIHNLCVSMVYLWYWLPANTRFDCLSDSDIKKKKTYIGFIISYFFKLRTLNPQYYF